MPVSNSSNKIRVVFARNPPDAFSNCAKFPTLDATVPCLFPGWTVEILTMITNYLGYEIIPVLTTQPDGHVDWGSYVNGSWEGTLGYLSNDTADAICLLYQLTQLRGRYFSYSYQVYNVKPIYVAKRLKTNISSGIWNAFKAYSIWVWLAMIAAFILQVLYSIIVAKVECKMNRRDKFEPLDIVWRYVKVQFNQPEDFEMKSFSGNLILLVFSLVQARAMMALYQSLLLSAIIAPPETDPFKSADDVIKLVASGEYKIITNYIGNWYFEDLAYSDSAHFRDLRAAVANNPVVVADSVDDVLDYVELGGYIFPIQEDSLAMQMSKERCGLVYVSNGLPEKAAYFVFQKNSTFTKIFDPAIKMQIDYIGKIHDKYFVQNYKIGNLSKCNEGDSGVQDSGVARNLSLTTTFGIFLVCSIGLTASITIFVTEIYFAWQHRVIKLKLRSRRAVAEPIHLMALAEMIGATKVQKFLDDEIMTPTQDEIKEHITIADSGFPY